MSGRNNRDLKARSDKKMSTSSKQSGHLASKGAEILVPLVRASPSNGTFISLEQKLNQISHMDETSSEMGHATQSCIIGILWGFAVDASSTRSSREDMNKDNILKVAIQAAMLKNPGIYKKNIVLDQADASSLDLNSEIAPHDQVSVSSYLRNMISAEGAYDGQAIIQGCSSDYGK